MKLLPGCRIGWVAMACVLGGPVWADAPADEGRERESIRTERAAIEAAYAQRERVCRSQFVVTSCIDKARAERQTALAPLEQRELALDDARRTQRAADRLRAIDAKVSGEEARAREEAARARSATRREPAEPKPAEPAASPTAPRVAKPASGPAERAESEARARAAYELKQLQAEAHRLEVARRNQERARKTNPGAPLPTPTLPAASGASAASAASAPKTVVPAR